MRHDQRIPDDMARAVEQQKQIAKYQYFLKHISSHSHLFHPHVDIPSHVVSCILVDIEGGIFPTQYLELTFRTAICDPPNSKCSFPPEFEHT